MKDDTYFLPLPVASFSFNGGAMLLQKMRMALLTRMLTNGILLVTSQPSILVAVCLSFNVVVIAVVINL